MWDEIRRGESFFLTDMELGLLLEAKGILSFQGFPLLHLPNTEEEILQTLFQMTGKGFLKAEGEEFLVAKEIGACLEILEMARGVLGLIPAENQFPQLCCYPGDEVLAIEPSAFREETYKIWRMSWRDLEIWIKGSGTRIEASYCLKGSQAPVWQARLKNRQMGLYLETDKGEEKFSPERLKKEIEKMEEALLR